MLFARKHAKVCKSHRLCSFSTSSFSFRELFSLFVRFVFGHTAAKQNAMFFLFFFEFAQCAQKRKFLSFVRFYVLFSSCFSRARAHTIWSSPPYDFLFLLNQFLLNERVVRTWARCSRSILNLSVISLVIFQLFVIFVSRSCRILSVSFVILLIFWKGKLFRISAL